MLYTFSVLKSIYETENIIVFEDDNFNKLQTKKEKLTAPLWNMSRMVSRGKNPSHVSGMIIDYDEVGKPLPFLNDEYLYHYHRSHSNKWRIIVPFDKVYDFTSAADYRKNYMDMLLSMYQPNENSVDTLIAEGLIDIALCNAHSFFFMRLEDNPLQTHHSDKRFKPYFSIKSINKLKKELVKFSQKTEIKSVKQGAFILRRLNNFYAHYRFILKWFFIHTNKKRCMFDWHDNHDGDVHFNDPSSDYPANIYCHHTTCYDKLLDFMMSYQLPPQDDKNKSPFKPIKNKTILYLAAAIIKGKLTLEQVEACGLHNNKEMLYNLRLLNQLRFNPKIDAPVWEKIAHEGIVMHPDELSIYVYKEGYYQRTHESLLKLRYHRSLGTYVAYKSGINTRPYIEDLVEYSKGLMESNFHNVSKTEGLSLKNGMVLFNDNGFSEFIPHTPTYFTTIQMDYEFDVNAKCPLWKKTLCDYFNTLNSPQVKIIQEYFAYCLTYNRNFEKLLFLFGESRGGKNTIVQTLLGLVPGAESSMKYLIDPAKRGPSIIDKKVVFIDEDTNLNNQSTVNELKKMSSTDGIQLKPLYCNPFVTHKVPKIIIVFDDLPEDLKIDKALRNRMLAVKVIKSFKGHENIHLKDDLLIELPGILNWVLEGYANLYTRGRFYNYDDAADELYESANEDKLDLKDFIKEKGDIDGEWKANDLFNAYLEDSGDIHLTKHKFGRMLKNIGIEKHRLNTGNVYKLKEE